MTRRVGLDWQLAPDTRNPMPIPGSARGRQAIRTPRAVVGLGFLAVVALSACEGPAEPPPPPLDSRDRLLTAIDSANVALRQFHAEGGRVRYVYLVTFQADTLMPPIIAISLLERP